MSFRLRISRFLIRSITNGLNVFRYHSLRIILLILFICIGSWDSFWFLSLIYRVFPPDTIDKRQTGLRIYKPTKCYNGYTLITHIGKSSLVESLPEPHVYLLDMSGKIVCQWIGGGIARLMPNGNLIYAADKIAELSVQSEIIWSYDYSVSHDFAILDSGNMLVERYDPPYVFGNKYSDSVIADPRIEIVTPQKEIVWQWKGEDHIEELEGLLGIKVMRKGEWSHNNTCEMLRDSPLAQKDTRFRAGNIIFSYCKLSSFGVIDFDTKKIVWAWGPGIIEGQHTPTLLDNGNILIFDNGGEHRYWSRVIELNPIEGTIVWEYHAWPKEDFYSDIWSNATRLPNGNTFVCEGTSNRVFEVTKEGEIVWDFISTFGDLRDDQGIYRAYRYSSQYVQPLLNALAKSKDEVF